MRPVSAVHLAAAFALIQFLTLALPIAAQQPERPTRPPNIVLILSDDEDLSIHAAMPKVKALIEDQGTVLDNFFVPYPLCCPSRAAILRGQYPHNTGVLGNLPPEGGFFAMVDVRGLGRPSDEIRRRLLHDGGVAVVHGAAYGPSGEGTLRVSFGSGGALLAEGLDRLAHGLTTLAHS